MNVCYCGNPDCPVGPGESVKTGIDADGHTPRENVLIEASELIHGDRNKSYGSPTENFANIADLWNVLLGHKLTENVTPREVADLMIAVKLARGIVDAKRDNYVDIAGYAACGWEAANDA